jgi:hypothetical protein
MYFLLYLFPHESSASYPLHGMDVRSRGGERYTGNTIGLRVRKPGNFCGTSASLLYASEVGCKS